MSVSKEKQEIIANEVRRYEQRVVDIRDETIFELSMKLGLTEKTVEAVWDRSL